MELPETLSPLPDRPDRSTARALLPDTLETASAEAGLDRTGGQSPPAIPGYEIVGELGRGGMGVVYRARQLALNRTVALKMIRGDDAGRGTVARFRLEGEAIARLQHPHIVQVFEVGEHQGRPFLALEYVEGGSLDRRLAGVPLPPAHAASLAEVLARAMQAAHESGVIHRDLKPANILLAAAPPGSEAGALGVPKITDFGLAKKLDGGLGRTHSGAVMGTPSYMAPEQAQGQTQEVGPACDVYALGAVLYELLTGRPPFKAETAWDTLWQVISEEPVPPRQLAPRCPRDLETICLRCLRKEPRRRYPSAAALAEDLRRFSVGEPILARPTPGWERALKWARRRPAAAALVVVVAVGAAGLLAATVWHQAMLEAAVDHALLEKAQERARAEEALEGQLRAEARALLLAAQAAEARQDWQDAAVQATRVLALAGRTPALTSFKAEAGPMLARAQSSLAREKAHQAAAVRYDRFWEQYRDALFRATRFSGLDVSSGLQATGAAAQSALALAGVSPGPGPDLDPVFSTAQQAQLRPACYELLLVLAEAAAYPKPDQSRQEERRQVEQALALLERAARFGPPTHPTRAYHLRRAGYLERLGDRSGAERERQRATLQPNGALDYFLLGEEMYQQGLVGDEEHQRDYLSRAAGAFETALRQQPDHFWSRYFLAICYLQLPPSHPPRANLSVARAALSACLVQRPTFAWAYLLRGYVNGELGNLVDAEADYQTVLGLGPDDLTKYALYGNRGVLRIRQGKLDEAIADLRQAIALKPDQYQAHVTLAHAYRQQNRPDLALGEIDQAIHGRPQARLYREKAHLLSRQDPGATLQAIEEAIRLDSREGTGQERAQDQVERGLLLYRAGRYLEAIQAYDAALQANPDASQAQRGRGETFLQLARGEEKEADRRRYYRESVRAFECYQRKGKKDAQALRACAHARAKLGDYPGAVEAATRALEVQPDGAGYAARGWLYLACEATQLAQRDFDRAVTLDPSNGDAYSGRGSARVKLGQAAEAVGDAEQAARLAPRDPRTLYKAARIFAQAAGASRALEGPDSYAVYRDRALELIGKALLLQPAGERRRFWEVNVERDAALDPLRRTPQFAQWRARCLEG